LCGCGRYALYGKERWSFVDASGTDQDYWSRVRAHFAPFQRARRPDQAHAARRMMRKGAEPYRKRRPQLALGAVQGPIRRKGPSTRA
jgi:hypothetical protein